MANFITQICIKRVALRVAAAFLPHSPLIYLKAHVCVYCKHFLSIWSNSRPSLIYIFGVQF